MQAPFYLDSGDAYRRWQERMLPKQGGPEAALANGCPAVDAIYDRIELWLKTQATTCCRYIYC